MLRNMMSMSDEVMMMMMNDEGPRAIRLQHASLVAVGLHHARHGMHCHCVCDCQSQRFRLYRNLTPSCTVAVYNLNGSFKPTLYYAYPTEHIFTNCHSVSVRCKWFIIMIMSFFMIIRLAALIRPITVVVINFFQP